MQTHPGTEQTHAPAACGRLNPGPPWPREGSDRRRYELFREEVDLIKQTRALSGWIFFFCLVFFPGPAPACRLYGVIAEKLPDGLLEQHLVTEPYALQALCRLGNIDGWGIGYVPIAGESPVLVRGAIRASADPMYVQMVRDLDAKKPHILLAHIRWCTSGCCAHGKDSIEDPHPFTRDQNGKHWIFAHNGGVDVTRMRSLIGEEYLKNHPPTGSGVAACRETVVDSELYFLYLLKSIEEHGGDVVAGITAAITSLVRSGEKDALNFILSDGQSMWAFRRSAQGFLNRIISLYMPFTLYYLAEPGYVAVASRYPSQQQGRWTAMEDYDLVVFSDNQPPLNVKVRPGR